MHETLSAYVERGDLPGLVALVDRGGDVEVEVVGRRSFDSDEPLQRDDLFRLASLTKPITAAAAMLLVDDGRISTADVVDGWLPELANRRVLRDVNAELDDTVPANRAITVDDLLTGRLGLGILMAMPGTHPIQRAEAELHLSTMSAPWPPHPHSPDEWMRRLGTLPLVHQPGEGWMYNTGTQLLGVLVERVSGQRFEEFLRERLFDPLGMEDTTFTVGKDDVERLTTAYMPDPATGKTDVLDAPESSWWTTSWPCPNAASWLVSTVDDYHAFARMLRDDGGLDGRQVLTVDSVKRMTTNHLTEQQRLMGLPILGEHAGWGYGLATPLPGHETHDMRGYGWNGAIGTSWRTDPATGTIGILLTQLAASTAQTPALILDFWASVWP